MVTNMTGTKFELAYTKGVAVRLLRTLPLLCMLTNNGCSTRPSVPWPLAEAAQVLQGWQ